MGSGKWEVLKYLSEMYDLHQFRARAARWLDRANTRLDSWADKVQAHPAHHWIRKHWLITTAAVAAVVLVAAFAFATTCGFRGCPSTESLQGYEPREGSPVLDREGAMLGRLQYVRRVNIPLDTVPQVVRDAFLQGGGWPAVWWAVLAIGGSASDLGLVVAAILSAFAGLPAGDVHDRVHRSGATVEVDGHDADGALGHC